MTAPPPAPPVAKSSAARLIILLVVLVAVTAVTAYDYLVAAPATEKADKDLVTFVIEHNERGIKRPAEGEPASERPDQFVRSADVQKIIGFSPTLVRKFENDQGGHVVEYYFFRPWLPSPELGKHYVAVVYWGLKNPRYMSHHANEVPPPETAPDYRAPDLPEGAKTPATSGGGVDPGTMPGGSAGVGGKMPEKGKGTGEKGTAEVTPPAEEKPANEKPAETKPTEEKPAEEKPAEATP